MRMPFGWTLIKLPQAESHERAHQKLMEAITEHDDTLSQAASAIYASIQVQQQDLTKINNLRAAIGKIKGVV